jgi:PAS domain S-box-containing protein
MQIRESEERFRNLVNSMPVMIWVSDENEKVVYSNKLLHEFLSVPMEEIKSDVDYYNYVHPDDRHGDITQWRNAIKTRKSILAEYRLKDTKGEYHNILEKAVPRFFADGKYAGHVGTLFDLTKEKQYQQLITVEKEKLELLTRNSPDIILLTNEYSVIEYVSPTAQRILGYKETEMIGSNLRSFICKDSLQQIDENKWFSDLKNKKEKFEYQMVLKSGKLLWVESMISVVKNRSDKGFKLLMHNRDIDSIKKAEFILKENEQKYRSVFENIQLGVMEVDLNERIRWVNKSFEKISGYSLRYLKGKNAQELFLADDKGQRIMNKVKRTRTQRTESIYEIRMRKNKGEMIDVVISGSPIIGLNGEVKGSVGIHWDVTEIRKMERMLEEEKVIRQREVMKATLNAEEQQRDLLGNELHDGVGHILTYTSLFLQMASQSEKLNPDMFIKAHQKVEEALKEVRRISHTLVPPALIDLGLKEAIIELFNHYSDLDHLVFSIDCKSQDFNDIDLNAQRNIYRMIQEMLNNTIKHAQAKKVKLTIRRTSSKLIIQYYNNGKYFNPEKVKKGVGLNSINTRAFFYNGNLNVVSEKNKGSHFNVELPLKNLINYE